MITEIDRLNKWETLEVKEYFERLSKISMQSWRSDVFVQSNVVGVETNGQCFRDDSHMRR